MLNLYASIYHPAFKTPTIWMTESTVSLIEPVLRHDLQHLVSPRYGQSEVWNETARLLAFVVIELCVVNVIKHVVETVWFPFPFIN